MPVALPPPVPPEPVPIAEVQRHAETIRYRFGEHALYLLAFGDIDRDAIDRLVHEAPTAEHIVLGLSYLVYLRGDMTSQVVYSIDGDRIYVMRLQRRLRNVRGAPELRRFFEEAHSDGRLEAASFERSRVLASAYSDRAGLDVRPRFVDAPGGAVDLDLSARVDDDASRFATSMEINNHGSRFAGRNLVALGVTGNSRGGTQGQLRLKTAPAAINESQVEGDYLEGEVQLNTVSPGGIVGLSARRIDFSADAGQFVLRGWYQEYGLEWSDVLDASATSRTMLRLRGAYSDRQSEREADSWNLFTEQYVLAELTPTYATSLPFGRFDAAVSAVGAWAQEQVASASAERFQLVRPMLRVRWDQDANAALTLTAAGQWASDVVAESQQWTLGGNGSLSAYTPAALIGDHGSLVRLGESGRWNTHAGWTLTAELFAEYGTAQRSGATSGPRIEASNAGLSLGASWRGTLELGVSGARPIEGPELADDALADFYATLKLNF